jgi:hypothetical protein
VDVNLLTLLDAGVDKLWLRQGVIGMLRLNERTRDNFWHIVNLRVRFLRTDFTVTGVMSPFGRVLARRVPFALVIVVQNTSCVRYGKGQIVSNILDNHAAVFFILPVEAIVEAVTLLQNRVALGNGRFLALFILVLIAVA